MIRVSREPADAPDSIVLVEELTADLATGGYPEESTHGYDVSRLVATGVAFFVARVAGEPVGCGGIQVVRDVAPEPFAELKRMYVRPPHRGTGVASAVMSALVQHAHDEGVALLRLETGARQHAAIAFYRREGFVERGPFPPYQEDSESVYMERRLEGPAVHTA